jgi:hypothetical protein
MKTGIDRNGNKVLRVTIAGARGFSIQTNGNLPRTHSNGVGPWTLPEASAWVKRHGTKREQTAMAEKEASR